MPLKQKIKDIVEPYYNRIAKKCINLFYYLPVRNNKIVFIQGCGDGYRCNLKYVAEEIIRQGLPYDLVWMLNFMNEFVPMPIRKVKYNRIKAVYELSTARVIINNTKSLIPVKKKNSQCFIYIPHGQPGCKCSEKDAKLPENYVRNSKIHSALTDVFVSMGSYHTQVLKDTFWVSDHAEIWEVGFPRNDIYYQDMSKKQQDLRKKLNVPKGYRIVMYAPTFRNNNSTAINPYNLDLNRVLSTLEKKTGDNWMFFVALHKNFIWFKKPDYQFKEKIWNVADYRDLHELLLIVDVVISDYSSVALDFNNMRRPVFLYASDLDDYNKTWGLKEMYFKMPFVLSRTNDEMEKAIMEFDMYEYQERLNKFEKIYGSVDDGHAAERFVNRLNGILKSE